MVMTEYRRVLMAAIEMRIQEGVSILDISEQLGVSMETVIDHLSDERKARVVASDRTFGDDGERNPFPPGD